MAQDITDFTTEYVHQHSNVNTPVNLNREKLSNVMICDSDTISPNATISSLVFTPNKSSDKLQNVLKTQIPNVKRISTPKRKHQSEETLRGKKTMYSSMLAIFNASETCIQGRYQEFKCA